MRPAILAGSMALPLERINVGAVKKALTHKYAPMGEASVNVTSFREIGDYLHVPRQYGINLCRSLEIDFTDQTTTGHAIRFPRTPQPRDYQVPVLDELEECTDSYYDFVFRARTGFGKTISTLILASRLGMSTMILVDQENLRDQWIESLEEHFGLKPSQVGIIQGDTCSVEGKAVSVGMIQTLSQKRMDPEVYKCAGFLAVDEVHTAGAPTFSRVLMDFHATVRMGVSATPKRRDGLQKLLDYNLGKVRVYVSDEHQRSSVHIAYHPSVFSWYANSSPKAGRYLTEVAEDGSRNLLIAEATQSLYEGGRDTLVLSDRIEQLTHLRNLCLYLGVPEEDMGVYTGQEFFYRYEKQVTPPRRPLGWVRGTDYSPIELKLISRKTPKAKLRKIKDEAKIIFATYQMFSKGVDVPRLSGGVDASPRSQAEQMHGRILREKPGKKSSIWVTVADTGSYRSLHQLRSRLTDYERNNAAFFTLMEDGRTEPCQLRELLTDLRLEVERLKSARIETPYAGLHTLGHLELRTKFGARVESATSPPARPSPACRTVFSHPAPAVKSPLKRRSIPTSARVSPSRNSRGR